MSSDEFAFIDWLRQRTHPKDARVAIGIGDDMAAVRWPSGLVLINLRYPAGHGPFRLGRARSGNGRPQGNRLQPERLRRDGGPAPRGGDQRRPQQEREHGGGEANWRARWSTPPRRSAARSSAATRPPGRAPTVIDVTILGEVPDKAQPILRSGARPGDSIYVTGKLGGSILGRHMTFEPRVQLAQELGCHRQRARDDRHQRRPVGRLGAYLPGERLRGDPGTGAAGASHPRGCGATQHAGQPPAPGPRPARRGGLRAGPDWRATRPAATWRRMASCGGSDGSRPSLACGSCTTGRKPPCPSPVGGTSSASSDDATAAAGPQCC